MIFKSDSNPCGWQSCCRNVSGCGLVMEVVVVVVCECCLVCGCLLLSSKYNNYTNAIRKQHPGTQRNSIGQDLHSKSIILQTFHTVSNVIFSQVLSNSPSGCIFPNDVTLGRVTATGPLSHQQRALMSLVLRSLLTDLRMCDVAGMRKLILQSGQISRGLAKP